MKEISIDEAKKRLMSACSALYSDVVLDFNYQGRTENSSAYENHGAIILKVWWKDNHYWWIICDSGSSDMCAAIKYSKEKFNYDKFTTAYFIGNIPENCNNIKGTSRRLVFTCNGKTYTDPCVRVLTENDHKKMIALTTISEDDNIMAKKISGYIMEDYDFADGSDMLLLGIFDLVTLVGAVSIEDRWGGELIYLKNIFISRDYRKHGYANRLTKAATSLHPNIMHTCDIDFDNLASIETAKSADFVLAGTYIKHG